VLSFEREKKKYLKNKELASTKLFSNELGDLCWNLLFLVCMPLDATRWRSRAASEMLTLYSIEMEPLLRLCVINRGQNMLGKLVEAEECLLLRKEAANHYAGVNSHNRQRKKA